MDTMTQSNSVMPSAETAVLALGALAQTSRLAVFRLLVQAGPAGMTAGMIAERIGLAPSALTFHIKALVAASLVSARKSGRYVNYKANYVAMDSLLTYLTENCCAVSGGCNDESHCSTTEYVTEN